MPEGDTLHHAAKRVGAALVGSEILEMHSHLRMGGRWTVYRRGRRWTRAPHRAWLVVRTTEHEVVQFDGPVLGHIVTRYPRNRRCQT